MTRFPPAIAAAAAVSVVVGAAAADPAIPTRDWPQEKCFRYSRDWDEALRRYGRDGLSPTFLEGNAAFIRSGCQRPANICPQTAKERRLADALAIRVVNEGMSTTFLPFDCPHQGP